LDLFFSKIAETLMPQGFVVLGVRAERFFESRIYPVSPENIQKICKICRKTAEKYADSA
jgi:hypothetical protein